MPSPLLELQATYSGEKHGTRRDAWAVHRAKLTTAPPEAIEAGLREGEVFDFVGESDDDELKTGVEYNFCGRIEEREYRGRKSLQFKFSSFSRATPHTEQAIRRYLTDAPHVGPKTAKILYERFGTDAVRTLRENPAAAVGRTLTLPQAEEAAAYLRELAGLEAVTLSLTSLLDGYGFPRATVRLAIREWGSRAPLLIKRNPYRLLKFRGVGLLKADKLYQSIDPPLPLNRLSRQALAAAYYLRTEQKAKGHTWFPYNTALDAIRKNVGGVDPSLADAAIRLAGEWVGLFAVRTDERGRRWIALGESARQEERLAELILEAMDEPNPWSAVLDHPSLPQATARLTDHQRQHFTRALSGGAVAILGGGPGAGKTFTAAAVMRLLVDVFGEDQTAITAFTGKAARRCTETMDGYGLPLRAVTTHSLLRVKGFSDDGDSTFGFGRDSKLPHSFIIVDEVSMDDVPLLLSIFEARAKGTGVLLIGDVNQLPPIGHGAPLRDLIDGGIPYGELTEIRRNAGSVVRFCKALRERKPIIQGQFFTRADLLAIDDPEDPKNLCFLPAEKAEDFEIQTLAALDLCRERFGFDPIWDCQVVVARNSVGDCSRVRVNDFLQRQLNRDGRPVPGCKFRVGDKAIVLKNTAFKVVDKESGEITEESKPTANGEFCRIESIDDKHLIARFWFPERLLAVPRSAASQTVGEVESDESSSDTGGGKDKSSAANFDLGYAATCHKMQGSQAKAVIVLLDHGAYGLSREWLLTAASRMEKLCVFIGRFSTVTKMAGRSSLRERKTFLAERLREGRLWGERVWWVAGEQEPKNRTELVTT